VHCCVSIEHKLGMGVPTAVLPVWRPAAPVSYIVVKKSTDYMFIMMNAARYAVCGHYGNRRTDVPKAVAFAGIACKTARSMWLHQGAPPSSTTPTSKRVLMTMRA
jgi:hypothetical protein